MGAVQPEAGQLQGLRVEIPQTYWSCDSVVNVFHSEDFFLYVLVIIVRHLLLVHLQEEPGSFFINLLSGSGRQQPNSSLSFSPPDRTAPVLSASLPNRMDGLRLGPPPQMPARRVTSRMCHIHTTASVDSYCSSSDAPRYV